ncbi:MAG: hypothetical protein PHW89_08005 [Sulfurimonas denitrificans]|nr:hypothetical protein [Sulfurimonas denitrificans]
MKKLSIRSRGIANISATLHGDIDIDLEQVDLSFLEQIPADKIVMYSDTNEVLKEIGYDTIVDFLESN